MSTSFDWAKDLDESIDNTIGASKELLKLINAEETTAQQVKNGNYFLDQTPFPRRLNPLPVLVGQSHNPEETYYASLKIAINNGKAKKSIL